MVQPRKIATEGALGSGSGNQLVSQFNTTWINSGALCRIKQNQLARKYRSCVIAPETTYGSIYSETVNLSKAPITLCADTGKRFWADPLESIHYTRLQPGDFSSYCVKTGRDSAPQRVLMVTCNIFRSRASPPLGYQPLKRFAL